MNSRHHTSAQNGDTFRDTSTETTQDYRHCQFNDQTCKAAREEDGLWCSGVEKAYTRYDLPQTQPG
jgi:hypothetical protein